MNQIVLAMLKNQEPTQHLQRADRLLRSRRPGPYTLSGSSCETMVYECLILGPCLGVPGSTGGKLPEPCELLLCSENFSLIFIMNIKAIAHLVRAEQLWSSEIQKIKAAFGGLDELPREPGRITVSSLDRERLIDLLRTSKKTRRLAQSALKDQSMCNPETLKEDADNADAVALNIRLKHGVYPPELVSQIFEDAVRESRANIVRVLLRRRLCGDLQLNLDRFIHPTNHVKTPLILAISRDPFNPDIAQRLIEAGADVNETISMYRLHSVLDWALLMAWKTDNANVVPFVQYLLQKGADYRLMGTLEDLQTWNEGAAKAVADLILAQVGPPRSASDPVRLQPMPRTEVMARHPSA